MPDPNNAATTPPDQVAALLRRKIQITADDLNQRVMNGQMNDKERRDRLAERAKELLALGNPAHSDPKDAWVYADLYITEEDYADAIPLLKTAVQYATSVKNDDRRVNDSLRLARCLAETGQVKPALDLAQSVIDSKPADPGPVLPSVLLELTPKTEGKGHDEQLAGLLEEAIHEHLLERVDPTSDAGKMFLAARPYHIHKAWVKIVELLQNSGHPDKAAAAKQRGTEMLKTLETPPIHNA